MEDLPIKKQLDPWGERPLDNGFEAETQQNSVSGKIQEKQTQEIVQNTQELEKQTEIIKELSEKQENTSNKLKANLENFTNKFSLSDSLLDENRTFNGVDTRERKKTFKKFDEEEQEIRDKGFLDKNDNDRLKELNQKRMGLILEQAFSDTLNLNKILNKILEKLNNLSDQEKQNLGKADFQDLSNEFSGFLNEFNQTEEEPIFYQDEKREDISFKRLLCDEYDKSMGLNKDVDRRTNYDQFLEYEVQKVGEKLQKIGEKVKNNPDKNSEKEVGSGSSQELSEGIKKSFTGESKKGSAEKPIDQDFENFIKNGEVDGEKVVSRAQNGSGEGVDTIQEEIERKGKNFFAETT